MIRNNMLFLFFGVYLLCSCGSEKELSLHIDESAALSQNLNSLSDKIDSALTITQLDADGIRIEPTEVPSGQKITDSSFRILKSEYSQDVDQSFSASLQNFGTQNSDDPLDTQKEQNGAIRIEVHSPFQAGKASEEIQFGQFIVDIPYQSIVSNDSIIEINQEIIDNTSISVVGKDAVQIIDEQGRPLEGIAVYVISFRKGSSIRSWESETLRTSGSLTDSSGKAAAFPIPLGPDNSYQIVAFAEGYCLYASPLKIFSPESSMQKITMYACEANDQPETSLKIQFDEKYHTRPIETNSGEYDRGFINDQAFDIKLMNKTAILRPMQIEIYGDEIDFKNPLHSYETASFESGHMVQIPDDILKDKGESFNFSLRISLMKSESDDQLKQNVENYLFGTKLSHALSVNSNELTIFNHLGNKDIIGSKSSLFYFNYQSCPFDSMIGFKVRYQNEAPSSQEGVAMVPCLANGDMSPYNFSDLGFDESFGGYKEIDIFITDGYGNQISTVNESFRKIIYVDFGAAKLNGDQSLSWERDIVLINATSEDKNNGTIFTEINSDNLEDTVFRFMSDKDCEHSNNSLNDGPGLANDKGHIISKFAIFRDIEDIDTNPEEYKDCGQEIDFSEIWEELPDDKEDKLTFYLHAYDLAGNPSEFQKISIKACKGNGQGKGNNKSTCWRNDE